MEQPDATSVRSSRRKLIILILIAFVPIFIAYASFFYFPSLAPTGTTNQGELIVPPVSGADVSEILTTYDNWALMQPVDIACDDNCSQMLYLSRQVITGLGKDAGRVRRVLLATGPLTPGFAELLQQEHGDVEVLTIQAASLKELPLDRPVLFLMDPNANIMMVYDLDKAGKPMLRDLKHLLKVSNIG